VFVNSFSSKGSTSHNAINSTTRDDHNVTAKKNVAIVYLSWYSDGLDAGIRFPAGVRDFIFSTSSRSALRPTEPPIQCVPVALSPEVKRQGREASKVVSVLN
jgi:hypothetical protein